MTDAPENAAVPSAEPPPSTDAPPVLPAHEPLRPEKLTATLIKTSLKAGRTAEVVAALVQVAPLRRAELFVQIKPSDQKQILYAAPPELSASILSDSDSASVGQTIAEVDLATIAPALRLIPPDNLADILLRLPTQTSDQILALLDSPLRDDVKRLLSFDPETAGGLMTTRYQSVPDIVSAGRALEILRASQGGDGPSYIYIVDAGGRLAGVAPLRKLLMANPRHPVREVMVKDVVRLKAGMPKEEIVGLFNQYHFISFPVVDEKDRLVGIVTVDDVMAAMRRAEETVIRGMTGVDPREALKETLAATRGRIPWMTVTIAGGLGCAFIGGLFQRTLSELVVLGIFIPIVLALGESIGAQTTSVVLSTLGGATSKAELRSFVLKEILVGVLVAIFSAVVVSLTSLFWHGNARLGTFIGVAVFISVTWAALLAVFIPGLMKKFRVNPAIASGPLVLALSDLSTLLVYFGGATLFMAAVR